MSFVVAERSSVESLINTAAATRDGDSAKARPSRHLRLEPDFRYTSRRISSHPISAGMGPLKSDAVGPTNLDKLSRGRAPVPPVRVPQPFLEVTGEFRDACLDRFQAPGQGVVHGDSEADLAGGVGFPSLQSSRVWRDGVAVGAVCRSRNGGSRWSRMKWRTQRNPVLRGPRMGRGGTCGRSRRAGSSRSVRHRWAFVRPTGRRRAGTGLRLTGFWCPIRLQLSIPRKCGNVLFLLQQPLDPLGQPVTQTLFLQSPVLEPWDVQRPLGSEVEGSRW